MREKLIELLGDNVCETPDCEECKYSMTDEACILHMKQRMADHLIANGVTLDNQVSSSKWIPVTERLPEDDLPKVSKRKMIRCLVYTDKGTVKPCVRQRCVSRKVDGEWVYTNWEWNKDIFAKPTHWMYLPEPPKGE